MYVRTENPTDKNILLCIDEIDRYLGQISLDSFIDCMDGDKEPLIENEFEYYFVDKEKLNFCFQSFSAAKP